MATELRLPLYISVNAWNAVRFIILELFVSVVFSALWNLIVRRSAARKLRQHTYVTMFSTNLGRFTPAEIGFCTSSKSPREREQRTRGLGYCLIVAVNVVLFASLLLLEYGSTDMNRIVERTALIVNEDSIRRHMERFAKKSLTLAQNPSSVLEGFQEATRLAMRLEKTAPHELPSYVLDVHAIDSNLSIAEKKRAVTFADVCGDGDLMRYPECQQIHMRLSGQKSNGGNRVFANVTHIYPFSVPFSNITRVYDVELQDAGLRGTCQGHRFDVNNRPELEEHYAMQTDACVLIDANSRVYVVFPDTLTSPKLESERGRVALHHLPGEPHNFISLKDTVMFETTEVNVLSFVPSMKVNTVAATLHLLEQRRAYHLLSENGWDFPVFEQYRRHIMLLCLALSGDYFESGVERFDTNTRQAAVNQFFLAGLGSLLTLSAFLTTACFVLGSSQSASIPVGMDQLLRRIRSFMCLSSEGTDGNNLSYVDFKLEGVAGERSRDSSEYF